MIRAKASLLVLAAILSILLAAYAGAEPGPTDLWLRGYCVIPQPRNVTLQDADVKLPVDWGWEVDHVADNNIAVRTLLEDLLKLDGLSLKKAGSPAIRLKVAPGTVKTGLVPEIDGQAYRMEIGAKGVVITGNSEQGLFYGVQTLLQLVRGKNPLSLPSGVIEDWPSYQIRVQHWDTKNHQDRMETLKGYLDWAARFKYNMISFEIWDKFQFESYPFIGVPGAFSPAQLQELVDYGLERFIQVVPNIQAPAHFQWALKHPQLAHLKADGSDYQACMCDEETYKVIFALYDDVIKATRGVDYIHASTDEVYYAGICPKCERPYNPENRSLAFVDFVNRAHDYLATKGRKMIIWAEWPLMPEHVGMLAPDIIDGVNRKDYFVGRMPFATRNSYFAEENKRGIRQFAYTAQTSRMAPMVFDSNWANLRDVYDMMAYQALEGNPIGAFGAGWDDSGPHSEVYWLGWSAVAQYSWTPGTPSLAQHVEEFFDIYHGQRVAGLVEIYEDLNRHVRLYGRSWDSVITSVPGKGDNRSSYGDSAGKYSHFRPPRQSTLPAPAIPFSPGLDIHPMYVGRYEELIKEARTLLNESYDLKHRIEANVFKADLNQYGLEILSSIADYTRHHEMLLTGLKSIEDSLASARENAGFGRAQDAVVDLVAAYSTAADIIRDRKETIAQFRSVWSKSRNPDYLTRPEYFEREESIGLEGWMQKMAVITREYAGKNEVPLAPIEFELQAKAKWAKLDQTPGSARQQSGAGDEF